MPERHLLIVEWAAMRLWQTFLFGMTAKLRLDGLRIRIERLSLQM